MMLFRRAKETDFDDIHHLAKESGVGITTLPKNPDLLQKRIALSTLSFKKKISTPRDEYYLFVLECLEHKKVVGTSAILSATGYDVPFYSYLISKHTRICHSERIRHDYDMLNLVNDYQGYSELCTLYLDPSFRVHGHGLLLSRARFLFIAQFPMRFAANMIAEMRGVADEKGQSPFWEQVGKHFFHMSFAKADGLTMSTNKQFITDLMPPNPIYVNLLSPSTQAIIGKPHPLTNAAMTILLQEGFAYKNYVDIFDAGPTIEASCKEIKTITQSKLLRVKTTMDDVTNQRYLLANTKLDFRATVSHMIQNDKEDSCLLSHETAELLEVKVGEWIRVSPLGSSQ